MGQLTKISSFTIFIYRYVKSYRQEDVENQLNQINKVLGASENTFEPGKNVEFNRDYDPMFRSQDDENEEDYKDIMKELAGRQ